jgi:L-fuconolactonase
MRRNRWIDTHHHLWHYNDREYPWMSEKMAVLRRDYLTGEIETLARRTGVEATVAVQARQRLEETGFLLETARNAPLIRGVVGWVPLTHKDVDAHLECYAQNPIFKGVRHVLHDEPDPLFMLREDFDDGVARLERYNLRYDLLVFAQQLPQTIALVDRHPNQIFILDHIAKPQIAKGGIVEWARDIRTLAERENIFCKISGMVTEADWNFWNSDQLRPYFDVVLDAFGPSRLMFGSDWPVLNLASTYEHWISIAANWLSKLSDDEAEAIQRLTATHVYCL